MERVNPILTNEEKTLLEERTIPPSEVKKALLESLRSRSQQPASEQDASTAQAIYDQHKINGSVLISVDIALPGGNGIINCRVNGEHKQIRF